MLASMTRQVRLVLVEGLAWPLREDVTLNDEGRITYSAEEHGLSARLTRELFDWTAWWEAHEHRISPHVRHWGDRLARDLQAELGPHFVVELEM